MSLDASGLGSSDVAAEFGAPLRVEVHDRGDHDVVTVEGELDLSSGGRLRQALHELVVRGRCRLVLDLDRVGFIDSSGLGVLIAAQRRIAASSGSMLFVCNAPRCRRLMEITGLEKVFTFHDTVTAAEAALSGSPQP